MSEETFSPSSRDAPNSINRMKERGRYDEETVYSIIDSSLVAHVTFNVPDPEIDYPVIIPMMFGRIDEEIFLHGHLNSRLLKTLSEEGTRCCLAFTHVDGLVFALTPFHNSMNYRSCVVFGEAHLIPDSEEEKKNTALTTITNQPLRKASGVHTGGDRWADSRHPTTIDMKSTRVVSVRIEMASAKVRQGAPKDEKKDVEDESVVGKYWTGVVTRKDGWDKVEPAPYAKVKNVPDYVKKMLE